MPIGGQFTWISARDELIERMGRRSSTDTNFTSRANEWLNSAQQKIAKTVIGVPDLEETISAFQLTPDVREYDLRTTVPALTDIIGIQHVTNVDTGYKLRRFPYHEYRDITSPASASPVRWTRRGHLFCVDPNPAEEEDLRIEYRRRPELDEMELDSEWQEDMIRLASFIGWSALQQNDRAKALFAELPLYLQAALNTPMDQEQWEASYDPDLVFYPA